MRSNNISTIFPTPGNLQSKSHRLQEMGRQVVSMHVVFHVVHTGVHVFKTIHNFLFLLLFKAYINEFLITQ